MKRIFLVMASLWLLAAGRVEAENNPYRSDVFWVAVPDRADWIYRTGERARVEVQLYKYGIPQDGVEVAYELGGDMMPADRTGSVTLRNGRAVIDLGTMDEPGFRDCRLTARIGEKSYRHHVKVGFSPERIEPYTQLPDDFDDFWAQALEEAARTPVTTEMERVDALSTPEVDCHMVRVNCVRPGTCVYGYLYTPKAPDSYPVVFCPPGAGVKPIRDPKKNRYYAEAGCIFFEIEIHGIRPDLDARTYADISNAFSYRNSYFTYGLDNRDNYYLRHVYQACVRCIDFLTSLPQWDGRNVIAKGGSQGGALAIVTAALSDKVTLCVANHPALSDMAGYKAGRAGGYPHFFNGRSNHDTPEKLRTASYYDVVNFARQLTVPIYLTWGFNDNTCPPTTSYAVYNVIRSPKEALITPVNEHWTSVDTEHGQLEWVRRHLR